MNVIATVERFLGETVLHIHCENGLVEITIS